MFELARLSSPIAVNGLFFGGRLEGARTEGTVNVQPDGKMTIQGTDSVGPIIFNWTFERKDEPAGP